MCIAPLQLPPPCRSAALDSLELESPTTEDRENMAEPMEIEGLSALPQPGLKGVGGILADLEKRALAEQAALSAATAAAAAVAEGSSSPGITVATSSYVPGAKKRRLSENLHATSASSSSSHKPLSSSNAGKANSRTPAVGQAGTSRDGSAAAAAANNSSSEPTPDASASQPKRRRQPTIRINFEWKNYPQMNRDKLDAKHVPIFQVRDMTIKAGLFLPPEETLVDDASSSGGSDDEDDGEKADASNNDADEVSSLLHFSCFAVILLSLTYLFFLVAVSLWPICPSLRKPCKLRSISLVEREDRSLPRGASATATRVTMSRTTLSTTPSSLLMSPSKCPRPSSLATAQ